MAAEPLGAPGTLRPRDAADLRDIVAWAAAEDTPLDLRAGGSKGGWGRPGEAAHTLDLRALSGVLDYEPAELVLTARAATPLADIEALLTAQRQMLAFEPPAFLGHEGATLGGVLATNLSGSRRVRAGAARDHFLGFAAVNGFGDAWKAGGKVVKNVTGYDLCKLQAGAFGTLSVLTEVSVRTLPRPETSETVLLHGLDDVAALRAMARALNTPHEVSAASHLPPGLSARLPASPVSGAGALTALRVEGPRPSVDHRAAALEALLGGGSRLVGADSEAFWRAVGAVQPLLSRADSIVWRICPTPSRAADIRAAVIASCPEAESFYDWGGGLLWVSLPPETAEAAVGVVRGALAPVGGHATLVRAPDALRRAVPVFQPVPPAQAALSRRVKQSFDPRRVLNRGRMQEDS